jgi:hypothetical protein
LPGVNGPTVATDPGYFNDRVVAQTSVNRLWANRALPDVMVAAGTKPWTFMIGRFRSVGFFQIIYGMGSPAEMHSLYISPGTWTGYFNNASGVGNVASDTNAHTAKQWLDGANINITIDQVLSSTGGPASLASDVTSVAFGSGSNNGSNSANACIAFFLVCAAKPTDAEIAALDAWAARYWGVPDRPPLPAATHSWWSGSHGMTPDNAFDQMPTGITLVGSSVLAADKPIVGIDGGFFNKQPVGQFNRNSFWGRTALVTTIAAGDRPWLYLVARMRSIGPAAIIQSPAGIGVGPTPQAYLNFGLGDPAWYVSGINWNAGGSVAVNTLPHRFKTWVAGAVANLTIDDVPSTSFGGGALATSTTSIWMGIDPGGNYPADACIALFLISKSKPTAAEEAALDAWARAFYGLP